MSRSSSRDGDLESRLTALEAADRDHLIAEWTGCFGNPPPGRTSQIMMVRAIAWVWQAREVLPGSRGALDPATRKSLKIIAAGGDVRNGTGSPAQRAPKIKPGTRFLRVWHGQRIEVLATDDGGFLWDQDRYASLSAIARAFTGARRNGPAFFGLRENRSIPE